MKYVIKRDGTKEDFDIQKIKRAITLAAHAADAENPCCTSRIDLCTELAYASFDGDDCATIEEIQDAVEDILMTH